MLEEMFSLRFEFEPQSSSNCFLGNHEVFFKFIMIPYQSFESEIVHEIQGGYLLKCVSHPYDMHRLHCEYFVWRKSECSLLYCIPIQSWIHKSYRCTCQSWNDYVALFHPHELDSNFIDDVVSMPYIIT